MEARRETYPYHFARRPAKTSTYAQFMHQIEEQENCKKIEYSYPISDMSNEKGKFYVKY